MVCYAQCRLRPFQSLFQEYFLVNLYVICDYYVDYLDLFHLWITWKLILSYYILLALARLMGLELGGDFILDYV